MLNEGKKEGTSKEGEKEEGEVGDRHASMTRTTDI